MDEENKNVYVERYCKFCKEVCQFINVGNQTEEWVCLQCQNKTSFGRYKFFIDRFGFHYKEKQYI